MTKRDARLLIAVMQLTLASVLLAPALVTAEPVFSAPPTSKHFCCQGDELGVLNLSGVWEIFQGHSPQVGFFGQAGFLYEGTELYGNIVFDVALTAQTVFAIQIDGGHQVQQVYSGSYIESWYELPNLDPLECLPGPQSTRSMCGYAKRFARYETTFTVRWCKQRDGFVFDGLLSTEMDLVETDSLSTIPQRMVINPQLSVCRTPGITSTGVTLDYAGNLLVGGFRPGGKVTLSTTAPHSYDELIFRTGDRINCWCERAGTNLPDGSIARRTGAASISELKSPLRFTVSSTLPLDLVTTPFRPGGQFNVLRQQSMVRERSPTETDFEWQVYLQSIDEEFEFIDAVPRFDNGGFIIDDLPLFTVITVGGRNVIRPARYALRLNGLNAEEFITGSIPLTTRFTVFSTASAFNLSPGEVVDLQVTPVDGISVKQTLIDELSMTSVDRYLPIENLVQARLNALPTNGISDAELEGLNRAVLAERVVRDGARFSEKTIDATLSNLGDLLANLVDVVLSKVGTGKSLKEKKDELQRIKGSLDTPALSGAGWSGVPENSAEVESAMSALIDSNFELKLSLVTEKIKYFLQVSINLLKSGLVSGGLDSDSANLVATVFETTVSTTLDIMVEQGVGAINSAAQEAVKAAVKTGKDELFNDLPSSYTDLTDEALAFSQTEFDAWGISGEAAYRQDRLRTESELIQLGVDASNAVANATGLAAIAGGFSSVESTLGGPFEKIPALKKAKLLATIGKFLTGTASVVVPFRNTFIDNPNTVKDGVARSYGQTSSTAFPLVQKTASERQKGSMLGTVATDQLRGDLQALRNNLDGLESAWSSDNLGLILGLLDADTPEDLAPLLNQIEQDVADVLAIVTTAQDHNTSTSAMQNAFFNAALGLDEAGTGLLVLNLELLGSIFRNEFSGPDDVSYRARRHSLLRAIKRLDNFADGLEASTTIYRDTVQSLAVRSPVVVRNISWVSQSTGSEVVSASGEVFILTADIRNLGAEDVADIDVVLSLPVNAANAEVLTGTVQSIGQLSANDAMPGGGADQASVSWQIQFTGPVDDRLNVPIRLETQSSAVNSPGSFGASYTVLSVNPEIFDPDNDSMPTAWEARNGLNGILDDGDEDADSDRVSNAQEFELGLSPQVADSDGDGLDDGDELEGITGWVTDPSIADTDGDGSIDSVDGSPLDPTTTAVVVAFDPVVQVSTTRVTLDAETPIAQVAISNAGTGTLLWRATSSNPAIVDSGLSRVDGGAMLTVRLSAGLDLEDVDGEVVSIFVADVFGAVPDAQEILVSVGSVPDNLFSNGFE